nr:hypothetical protein [Tanacetum cinerariifolium]
LKKLEDFHGKYQVMGELLGNMDIYNLVLPFQLNAAGAD